jgi:hypothetical protein
MQSPRFGIARRILFCAGVGLPLMAFPLARAEDALPQLERLQSSAVLRHLKPNPQTDAPKTEPERTVAKMFVPEGFKVELIAAEPDLHQPVAFAWDERGRIWIVEAYSYPAKRPGAKGWTRL